MSEIQILSSDLEQALLSLNRIRAEEILAQCQENTPLVEVVEHVVAPAMERIGSGWEQGDVALSQIYMSSRICEDLVTASVSTQGADLYQNQPKTAIVVLEDFHLLGKRIVYSVLRASGLRVNDLGQMDADALLQRIVDDEIEILLISTLMLRSALRVGHLTKQLKAQGREVKIVVGGAPFRFDGNLWKEVGADATANTATEALPVIKSIMGEMS
ncbi:MAG: cobalamin-dependent protein [Sedimenticola sp.]